MLIKDDVLHILKNSIVDEVENILYLPKIQLDRKLYVDVNKVLESIGGAWNKKIKGHVFDSNPSDILDEIINTGNWTDKKKEYQFFRTPKHIVKQMIKLSNINKTDVLLEPSAGDGAILEEFPKENSYWAFELMPENCEILKSKGFVVHGNDFIEAEELNAKSFDKIIMNPPFTRQQDVQHIFHAWKYYLKTGGRLVSIVSESPFFRENKLSQEFRKWLDDNNSKVIDLNPGDFKESGTMVKTRIIIVDKL